LTFNRLGGGTYVGSDGYIYGIDSATSASLAIGTGSKSVTLTATASVDRRFQVGQTVYFSSGANNMSGLVTAYNASTQVITINATATTGSGSFTSWFVGNASPRFDYSPTNIGEPRGLLIEGQTTNYLPFSVQLSGGSWFSGGLVTKTTAYATGPDGVAFSATRLQMSYSGGTGRIYYDASASYATKPYTTSVWLKSNTGSNQTLGLLNSSGALINLVVTPQWQRFETINTTGTTLLGYFYLENSSTNPAVVADVLVWGAQLEAGSSPASSYIPTGASQVTRAVDTAIIAAGTNFSSWYTGNTSGTFVANWYGSVSSTTARSVMATSDQTTKHLHLYQTPSALTLRLADFGAAATVTTGNNLTANALTKGAFSYASTATSLCLNGGTVATGTLAFTVAPTWLSIGGPSTNGTSITDTTVMLNNSIRTLKYFPARLSDAQIKEITT
jgi:hypothetical protein